MGDNPAPPGAVLIAGPTASGKSQLALALAKRLGGVVINADSMQVYAELRVLTARPTAEDEGIAPHRLYGHVPASEHYSVARWLSDAAGAITEATSGARIPVVIGGTGLYFRALTEGLAAIPPIPAAISDPLAAEARATGSAALHARLAEVAPEDARRLHPGDTARVVRALGVVLATGRPISAWQHGEATLPPLVDAATALRIVLWPDRALLSERIAVRASTMAGAGALDEVARLRALDLAATAPAMKAIGVAELGRHLDGETSLDEAIAAMATRTRRYAKRQATWFRNQMHGWLFASDPAVVLDEVALAT